MWDLALTMIQTESQTAANTPEVKYFIDASGVLSWMKSVQAAFTTALCTWEGRGMVVNNRSNLESS